VQQNGKQQQHFSRPLFLYEYAEKKQKRRSIPKGCSS